MEVENMDNNTEAYLIEHLTSKDSKAVGIFSHTQDALAFIEALIEDKDLFTADSKFVISKTNKEGIAHVINQRI